MGSNTVNPGLNSLQLTNYQSIHLQKVPLHLCVRYLSIDYQKGTYSRTAEYRNIKMVKTVVCTLKRKKIEAQNLKLESKISFLLQTKDPKTEISISKAATELYTKIYNYSSRSRKYYQYLSTDIIYPKKTMNTFLILDSLSFKEEESELEAHGFSSCKKRDPKS